MISKFRLSSIATLLLVLASCGENGELISVKIGTQVWMTKNLSLTTYRNGDSIPEVQDSVEWAKLETGAWCYYENKKENDTKYGKLYNWYAINDPRGLAPQGWHIPIAKEWEQLFDKLGGILSAGKKMKSGDGWSKNGNGTNESGFTGLPGGGRNNAGMFFSGEMGAWWSLTDDDSSPGEIKFRVENQKGASRNLKNDIDQVIKLPAMGQFGLSVRCVKDLKDSIYRLPLKNTKNNAFVILEQPGLRSSKAYYGSSNSDK